MQKLLLSLVAFLFVINSWSQARPDTLHLSLPEAEKIFLQKSLPLLAAKYNIDASKALVQQAKLWDNPVLVTDQNVYDGKFFRHNADNGQIYVQVQQLIRTAGKRNKEVQLAQDNVVLAQEQFDEVMRGLQYALRTDMLETERLLKVKNEYQQQVEQLTRLSSGMDEVYKTGNISLKDDLRLKAILYSLQNELAAVQTELIPVQGEIRLILQLTDNSFVTPEMQYKFSDLVNSQLPPADSLIRQAINNRPDARIAKTNLDFQQHNLSYQKALAKPDLTIGPEYDRRNSYQPDYVGLSISLPLNIFNKNQGNIKAAKYNIQVQQTELDQTTATISNEVLTTLNKITHLQSLNSRERQDFAIQYEKMFQNMLKSYRERQISLLDLTDFLDSYKTTRLEWLEQQDNLVKAIAELNYLTNSTIISIQ